MCVFFVFSLFWLLRRFEIVGQPMRNNINSLLLPSLYLIRDMLLHACSLVGLTSQHATSFQLHMTLWKSSESSAIMCVCVFGCVSMCMCACRSVCDRAWLLHVASLITRELMSFMSFMSFHMTLLDAFGRLWFGSGAAPSPIEARARAVGVGVQHLQCSQCRARRGLRDRHHHRGNRSGIRRWRQWSRTEIDWRHLKTLNFSFKPDGLCWIC